MSHRRWATADGQDAIKNVEVGYQATIMRTELSARLQFLRVSATRPSLSQLLTDVMHQYLPSLWWSAVAGTCNVENSGAPW